MRTTMSKARLLLPSLCTGLALCALLAADERSIAVEPIDELRSNGDNVTGLSAEQGEIPRDRPAKSVVALSKAQTGRKVGLASPSLYKLFGTSALTDVRASSTGVYLPFNPTNGAGGDYVVGFDGKPQHDLQSKAGWDNVTGVGTPNGAAFLSGFGK